MTYTTNNSLLMPVVFIEMSSFIIIWPSSIFLMTSMVTITISVTDELIPITWTLTLMLVLYPHPATVVCLYRIMTPVGIVRMFRLIFPRSLHFVCDIRPVVFFFDLSTPGRVRKIPSYSQYLETAIRETNGDM